MVRAVFLTTAAPRSIIDPFDSSLTAVPGAVTFSDPRRPTNGKGENWRTAATARFVPRDPDDLEVLDAVYSWCFEHYPRAVWTNECAETLPVRGYPKAGKRVVTNGGKRMIFHAGESQRPREIMPALIANAHHLLVWPMPNPDDVRRVADLGGLDVEVLRRELALLERFGFVWIDQEAKTLTSCPALRVR